MIARPVRCALLAALALSVAAAAPTPRPAIAPAVPGPPAQADVFAAMQRASELAAGGDLERAIDVLREVDVPATHSFYRAHLRVRIGEFQRALGHGTLALESFDSAVAEVGEVEGTRQLRCYMLAVRAQVLLDWGLLDVASRDARRARELLVELESGPEPPPLDAERIQVDYVEATILATREDYLELDAVVADALRHEAYARHPERAALLTARLGLGLKEAARLAPELAPRAREALERALAGEALPPLERVSPELALCELALREGRWPDAQLWIDRAGEHLGTPAERVRLPQHPSWLALCAQLAFERRDLPLGTDPAQSRLRLEELRAALAGAAEASLEEWGRRELRPGGYGYLQYAQQRSLLSEWVRLELALAGETAGAERALEAVIRASDASTLARRLGAERTDLAAARAELLGPAAEHVLLVYFPAPDRSHLFALDRERTVHIPLAPNDVLQEARLAVVHALAAVQRGEPSAATLEEWRSALGRLAALVLPPAARDVIGARTRVTIVGRDLLGDLPFEALPLGSGRWLGTSYAVSYLPSLAVGRVLAARAARETRPALGESEALLVAAPSTSGLALERERAEEMLAPYPAGGRRLAFGADASVASLRAASTADVLEVFTHGRRDPARERPMTFLLDGRQGAVLLGADEVEALEVPSVVVLSVCRSGEGPKRRGDAGAGELATAFFLAGSRARCVVASAFDLDAEATARLSRAFHAALAAGKAPDEALRVAREELGRDARFADPRFHGLLGAIGAAREPLFRP